MLLTWAVSLLWLLPGLAFLQRFAPREPERGALSAIALGYAASAALLAPFSLLGYAFGWPLWPLCMAIALMIALGAAALIRARAVPQLLRAWAPDLGLPALGLLFLLALDARTGGWLDGDATYHLGRIRDLIDHGLNNRDFLVAQPYFAYAYHTNLAHALYAAVTQLTDGDPLEVWFASLPFAKLMMVAAHYHLAHSLSGKRSAGWLAAIGVAAARAGETYAVYPNLLAVGWLLPLALSFGFAAHEPDAERPLVVGGVAITSFLLGQVHAMYWAIACIALAPALVLHWLARRASRKTLALCLIALLAGAPFALIARYAGQPSAAQVRAAALEQAKLSALAAPLAAPASPAPRAGKPAKAEPSLVLGGHLEKQLLERSGGNRSLAIGGAAGWGFLLSALAVLLAAALWPAPWQPRMLALLAAALTLFAIPLVPALCTLFAPRVLPDFGVARMITPASSLAFAAAGCVLGELLERRVMSHLTRQAVILVAGLAASQLPGHAPRSFAEHVANAFAPEAARYALLTQDRARRALLQRELPCGETVLTTLREARYVAMLADIHVIAADRGHGRLPDLRERRQQVELMMQARTPWPVRRALLEHYRIRFVIYRDKHAGRFAWTLARGHRLGSAGGLTLVGLEL